MSHIAKMDQPEVTENNGAENAHYEVLARKYRPRNFDDLIGHEAMVRTLENAFTAGRIAHAYILTGVRGVGKTTTARILARALNYQASAGPDHGPQIHMKEDGLHCQAIAESRHPDVMEMDAASRTGVGDIRELIEGVRYAPIEARYKVYIIDEVHMLSTAAFNALLKTLEEPPPHVKFIFATTEIRKLPVTVLSRCQRFDLRRIAPETLITHLEKIAHAEGVDVDPEGLAIIVRAAEGSVRDALSILDQAIVQLGVNHEGSGKSVSATIVQEMLGLADRSQSWDLLNACLGGVAPDALSGFRQQYDHGADPVVILRDLLELVHLLTRTKAAGPAAASHGPAGVADAKRAVEMAEALSMNALTRAWTLLMKGYEETRLASDPVAAGEMALIRLCYAADLPTPDEALRLLKAGPLDVGKPEGAPRPAPTPISEPVSGPVSTTIAPSTDPALKVAPTISNPANPNIASHVPLTSLKDIAELAGRKKDIRLRTEIEGFVHLVSFEPQRISLRLANNAPEDLPNRLMRSLKEWTGDHWSVTIDAHTSGDKTLRDIRHAEVLAHPMVAKAMALFPGAVVEKIKDPVIADNVMMDVDKDESDTSDDGSLGYGDGRSDIETPAPPTASHGRAK